jgi:hypothetical protein
LELELRAVQRELDELNGDKFGATSERRGRKDGKAPKRDKKPQTGHGPTPQPDLPRDLQLHLLDEPDQICPKCEPPRPLAPWGDKTADSEELTVIEKTFTVIVHKRQVYRCDRCGHIETALGPDRLITGGRYSPEFAVAVAADKYGNNQPLASQVREMANLGLRVTTQTLWDQLFALYVLLLPVYLMLQKQALDAELIDVDETSWRLMKNGGSKRWCCSTAGLGSNRRAPSVLSVGPHPGSGGSAATPLRLRRHRHGRPIRRLPSPGEGPDQERGAADPASARRRQRKAISRGTCPGTTADLRMS